MAVKDISTITVLKAVHEFREKTKSSLPEYLTKITQQPSKVCLRALERELRNGYIDFGVSLNFPWLTQSGINFISK